MVFDGVTVRLRLAVLVPMVVVLAAVAIGCAIAVSSAGASEMSRDIAITAPSAKSGTVGTKYPRPVPQNPALRDGLDSPVGSVTARRLHSHSLPSPA